MKENKNNKNLIILLISTILLLLGYLLYDSLVNDGLSQEELVAELNDVKAEYENIQMELNKRNDNLAEKNEELIKIQSELEAIFSKSDISEEELNKSKKLIKDLSKIAVANYKEKIVDLEVQNVELVKTNEILVIKTTDQEKSIEDLKSKLTKEITVSKEKNVLLEYASNLMASNFVLKSYKVRDSGKEIETEKGSRVDRIKVFFDIPANKVAKSGKKDLCIRIILPDGKLAILEGKNGLQFKSEDNKMIDCSEIITIDYKQGSEDTVHFNWDSKDGFESGDYVFEVFQNGRLIGKASKFLR